MLGEVAAQAATSGEYELTTFAFSCIRFVVHPADVQRTLVLIYRTKTRMKGLVGLTKCEYITYSRLLRVEKVAPLGFKPATYRSRSRYANHTATA